MISIMIVDDHGLIREGLKQMIELEDDMEVIGEALNGLLAIDLVRQRKPDVVLMDVSMPVLNGIEATRQILSNNPDVKVLALSAFSNKNFVCDMLKAGASGYLIKDCLISELVNAIRTVMRSESYLSTRIAGIVIDSFINHGSLNEKHSKIDDLTGKERQLLQLLAEGNSNKEAARLLHVSTKTVDGRRRSVMDKLDIDNVQGLTKYAIREGITSVDF